MHVPPSKVLAAMLLFSGVCMLLHLVRPSWGDQIDSRARQLSQPVALLAAIANKAAPSSPDRVAAPTAESTAAQNQLEGQILAMAEELRSLRRQNAELVEMRRKLSERDAAARRLGRLLPAEVITRDSLAYRHVLGINRGQQGGATAGQWVASALFIDRGTQDGLQSSANVFTMESLVGRLNWTGPFLARVQLLTDPASRLEVLIARIHPDRPRDPVGYAQGPDGKYLTYTLQGAGKEGMVISQQVDYRDVQSGRIRKGDLVIAAPQPDLPESTVSLRRVGRIREIVQDSKQWICTLRIDPLVEPDTLRHVYVFDPTPIE